MNKIIIEENENEISLLIEKIKQLEIINYQNKIQYLENQVISLKEKLENEKLIKKLELENLQIKFDNQIKDIQKNSMGEKKDLFLVIWRNIYLKNQIIKHLQLFNNRNSIILFENYLNSNFINNYNLLYLTKLIINSRELEKNKNKIKELLLNCIYIDYIEILIEDYYKFQLDEIMLSSTCSKTNNITKLKLNFKKDYLKISKILYKGCIPKSINTVIFDGFFNQELFQGILHHNIETLVFGDYFNSQIQLNIIPDSVKTLIFGWSFNQKLYPRVLPSSLTHLTLGQRYDTIINNGVIPPSLKILKIKNTTLDNTKILSSDSISWSTKIE